METYSKINIYYFTGTGNSQTVARWIEKVATEKKMDCAVINIAAIESFPVEIPEPGTLLIFISPVHGFNYPPVMLQFLSHFPKGKNKVILMNTRAGMLIGKWVTPGLSGIAFYLSALILKSKGYSIQGMLPVDLPSNWMSLHPGLNKPTVLFLHEKMKAKVTAFAEKVLDGKKSFTALREIVQDLAVSPISLLYYLIGRFVLAKTFYASAACNNCGACIKKCPVKAIIWVDEKPFWKLTCESCMRCMSNCPHKAIETAHGFIILVAVLFHLGVLGLLNAFGAGIISSLNTLFYELIVQSVLFLGLLAICYRAMHLLKRFSWFEKVMVYTSLTHYRFWGDRYRSLGVGGKGKA